MSPETRPAAPDNGLPLDRPLAGATDSVSAQARDDSGALRGPKHPSGVTPDRSGAAAEARTNKAVRASRLAAIEEGLSNRDWQVLYLVDQHGYLTTHHLQAFVFTGHASEDSAARSARRVLRRLERDGLIRCLPRRRGGLLAGSAPATWQLAPAGARLVHQNGERYRTRVPSLWHLRHCLALADVHLLLRAISGRSGRTVEVGVEHQAQRLYTGLGGESLWLKPDLEATIRGTDEHGPFVDRWFIEVDLGTESLPTLERKCLAYATYRLTGREQADGGVFPLVLWVMAGPHAEARQQALGKVVAGSSRLTPELYRFAQLEDPASLVEILGGES